MPEPFGLVVKALVHNGEGHVLIIRRSAGSLRFAGTWDLPGGKVDPGEPFEAALLREAKEETGLAIALEDVAGATGFSAPSFRAAVLVMEAKALSQDVRLSDEHDAHEWVLRSDIPRYTFSDELHDFLVRVCAAEDANP